MPLVCNSPVPPLWPLLGQMVSPDETLYPASTASSSSLSSHRHVKLSNQPYTRGRGQIKGVRGSGASQKRQAAAAAAAAAADELISDTTSTTREDDFGAGSEAGELALVDDNLGEDFLEWLQSEDVEPDEELGSALQRASHDDYMMVA